MTLDRNKLYSVIFLACAAGYIWLYFFITRNLIEPKSFEVCLFKHVTNVPCPSCGSTRAIVSISKGNFIEALSLNPIGFLVIIIMVLAPFWVIVDILTRKRTLFLFYKKIEVYLKRPEFAIPLILLVIINWIWNITKGL